MFKKKGRDLPLGASGVAVSRVHHWWQRGEAMSTLSVMPYEQMSN